jgi:hypothetical protein
MRRKLAVSVVSGFFLLACAVIVVTAVEMAPPYVEAENGRTVEWDAANVAETPPSLAGTALDGTSRATRRWDEKKTEVISRLLDRPRRWSKLLEDWSDHILGRVMTLGAPGVGMAYMMLMLSFSLVHAFPQKTARPQRPARKARSKKRAR